MRFEGAKNFILTILVAASAFLTWNIWTYQPKYDKIDQKDLIGIASDEQKPAEVIKPGTVLFHKDGKHFQTNDENEINSIQTELTKWTINNFKDVSRLVKQKRFTSFVHADGNTEVIFPDAVPLDLFVLDIDDQQLPRLSFDRIVVTTGSGGNEGKVYFINYKHKQIFQSEVSASNLRNFSRRFAQQAEKYPEYISKEVNANRMLFLPKKPVQLTPMKYYINYLDIDENFKVTLFSDPEKVKQEKVSRGREYTDGSSLLSVIDDSSTIKYVNPAQRSDIGSSQGYLLQKGINFINNHAGWDDNYQYADISADEQKVTFRLFIDGYPVFNEQGMSEIKQEWGNEEVYRYERPYFTLGFKVPPDNQYKVTLPSGEQAMELLKQTSNFELSNLEDVKVGYKLSKDAVYPKLIHFEPSWYYRYGGTWTALRPNRPGGEKSGLE
ncbi:hypothetical protein ELQ35_21555 [Peribacillus cavernae]|uniref:Regulatory protein YycH domain-containing protein n=1 Tax=Peribacillus cavernae TaxID=1674310 RepID=A0A3S0W293_9BACI|nr:two-component system activity regulator YycH [Peribacillus cavernae]MDQ0220967.1 regulatory protein YycH of two-component signal transduction system YycFG [Peribacillus cavernae]RUQ24508.1 hypothetical protein ELQ35_21555 [Peribacillus cavernae]